MIDPTTGPSTPQSVAGDYAEVVYQFAVGFHRLGADAGASGADVLGLQLWQQPL